MRNGVAILAIWSALGGGAGWAQETSALVGTVTDPSGGVLAGTKITATNVDTGLTREVETSATGDYAFPDLPVGTVERPV
jgi:Carboxypeptidase regulatory-like domain